jgi:hypothetical protein
MTDKVYVDLEFIPDSTFKRKDASHFNLRYWCSSNVQCRWNRDSQ